VNQSAFKNTGHGFDYFKKQVFEKLKNEKAPKKIY
jgi:hypothetical protein